MFRHFSSDCVAEEELVDVLVLAAATTCAGPAVYFTFASSFVSNVSRPRRCSERELSKADGATDREVDEGSAGDGSIVWPKRG